MAINFGLFKPDNGPDYLETLRALGQQQALQQQTQMRAYDFNRQQQIDQARPQIQQLASSGDIRGAQERAFAIGDYDALKTVSGLQAQQHEQLAQQMGTLGRLATSLIKLPQSERVKAYQAVVPMLAAQGYDKAQLAAADLSDAGLNQYIAAAASANDVLKSYYANQEDYTLAPGSRRYNGSQLVAENPAAPKYVTTPAGAVSTLVSGGGGDPASTAGDLFSRVLSAESGGRQFGANGQPLTSSAGAVGIAQVMPNTGPEAARLAGVQWDPERYRSDPAYNAQIGRAYFEQQLQQFGDPAKAAAAYNAGPGRVQQAVLRYGDAWLDHLPNETKQYVGKVVGGPPQQIVGQPRATGGSGGQAKAPSGYEWDGNGGLRPIRGGPADKPGGAGGGASKKDEATLRKEFEQRQDVKDFRKARTQFNALRETALNPNATAQDDIAVIFQFMKTLDPTSTVREGEFATAQNAGGIPDNIRNAFNKAQSGTRLNSKMRRQMAETAYKSYQQFRNAYNSVAGEYRSYASDYGVNPDRVARTYTPDKPARGQQRGGAIGVGQSTTVGAFKVTRVK
jgi:hypothetical protein